MTKLINIRIIRPKEWTDNSKVIIRQTNAYLEGIVESVGDIYITLIPTIVDFMRVKDHNDVIDAVTISLPRDGVGVAQTVICKYAGLLHECYPLVSKGYRLELCQPGFYVIGRVNHSEQIDNEQVVIVTPRQLHYSANIMG